MFEKIANENQNLRQAIFCTGKRIALVVGVVEFLCHFTRVPFNSRQLPAVLHQK
jgi:hypothetical protein